MILLKDNQQNLRNHCKYQIISKIKIEHVILDCSSMIYVDPQGVEIIRNVRFLLKIKVNLKRWCIIRIHLP